MAVGESANWRWLDGSRKAETVTVCGSRRCFRDFFRSNSIDTLGWPFGASRVRRRAPFRNGTESKRDDNLSGCAFGALTKGSDSFASPIIYRGCRAQETRYCETARPVFRDETVILARPMLAIERQSSMMRAAPPVNCNDRILCRRDSNEGLPQRTVTRAARRRITAVAGPSAGRRQRHRPRGWELEPQYRQVQARPVAAGGQEPGAHLYREPR